MRRWCGRTRKRPSKRVAAKRGRREEEEEEEEEEEKLEDQTHNMKGARMAGKAGGPAERTRETVCL